MGKKYIQKPGAKPGGMILEELREQEIKNGDLKWNEDLQRYVYTNHTRKKTKTT
jgi:hypothetical protein